jgi:hypothetical protein
LHPGGESASWKRRWLLLWRWRCNASFLIVEKKTINVGDHTASCVGPRTSLGSPGGLSVLWIPTGTRWASLRILLGCRCPFPLHRVPIDGSNIDVEPFFLKTSEGSLDVAVVLVTELCHRHSADDVRDFGQLKFVAVAECGEGV